MNSNCTFLLGCSLIKTIFKPCCTSFIPVWWSVISFDCADHILAEGAGGQKKERGVNSVIPCPAQRVSALKNDSLLLG